jgi:hypothetical protein
VVRDEMAEKLTWDEITKRYPDEWVALVDVEWPNMGDVVGGVVFAHDPDHATLLEKQRHLKSGAVLWTGKKRGVALLAAVDVDR